MKGGWASARRLDLANSNTCVLELAETRVVAKHEGDGQGGLVLPIRALARSNLQHQGWWVRRGLGFANSSTCALEFAGPRVVDAQGDSVLPIRALACSNLQNQGWRWTGRLGFANSSTCALEFAEPGVVGGRGGSVLPIRALARSNLQDRGGWMPRGTRFCQFKHLRARICRTKSGGWTGRLGFANSSTWVLEFAEPRVVGGRGDLVLPIRALARSNLQDREWWVRRGTRFCRIEHGSARIRKPRVVRLGKLDPRVVG